MIIQLGMLALSRLRAVRHEEDGQTMIEYALLAFLVAIAAVVLLSIIGFDIKEVFDSVENEIGSGTGEVPAATGDNDGDTATTR